MPELPKECGAFCGGSACSVLGLGGVAAFGNLGSSSVQPQPHCQCVVMPAFRSASVGHQRIAAAGNAQDEH